MPTNLKDRTVNGLFGTKVIKFVGRKIEVEQIRFRPRICLQNFPSIALLLQVEKINNILHSFAVDGLRFNIELDRKRIKHLASTIQDIFSIEMKYTDEKLVAPLIT